MNEDETPTRVAPSRTRSRRLSGLAVLFALVAIMSVWASAQPWWHYELPSTQPVTADMQQLAPVTAEADVSAKDIVSVQSTPETPAFGTSALTVEQHSPTLFGLPQAAGLLLVAAVFVIAGVALKLTPVAALGALCLPFAWSAHQTLVKTVENPSAGGSYVTRLTGLELFQMTLLFAIGLALVTCLQIFMVNAQARAKARAKAKAEGKQPSPVLALVWSMLSAQMSRFDRGTQDVPHPKN
jgi:hypothetical protein